MPARSSPDSERQQTRSLDSTGLPLDASHSPSQWTALPRWEQQEFPYWLRVPIDAAIERRTMHLLTTPVLPVPKIAATMTDIAAKAKRDAQTPRWLPALAS